MIDPYSYHCWQTFAVNSRNPFPHLSIYLVTLGLFLGLAGCAPTQPPPIPPKPTPEPIQRVEIPRAQLFAWLDQADAAIERNQLINPEQGSAYDVYQQILRIDPEQQDALRGLERLVEIHVERAMRAVERRHFAAAQSLLNRAHRIIPNHPSIEPSAAQLRLIMSADIDLMKLSQPDLTAASRSLQRALADFADVRGQNCRFIIHANSDQQGRWIYQTMSKGLQQGRLRAQLRVRLPASVERLCFAAANQEPDTGRAP